MKKIFLALALVNLAFFTACNNAPKKPDGTPRTNENTPNSDGTGHSGGGNVENSNDKYDGSPMQDTSSKVKGTAIRDSSSGLGGKR